MERFSLLVPLLLALSSTPHCLGMCGGIVGAAAFHRARFHGGFREQWPFLLAANAGKMVSYAMAGGMAATFGHSLLSRLSLENGHLWLLGGSGLILIGNGMFLLGHFPLMRHLERLGNLVWRLLEPLARQLIRASGMGQGFLLGMVWGWFPCTLVYGALLWSSAACSPASGALVMALFGLGTFPAMIGAGWLTGWLARFGGIARFSTIIAWLVTGFGIFCIIIAVWSGYHPHMSIVDSVPSCHDPQGVPGHGHDLFPLALCPIAP
ncbi:MAG: sulfite exporter TauE/SafE family protein [Magnetococcales bacterium]|nr:sulfite exporter TauE/SafE family protein [Magnetococcales bacterium]